jgi:hypothetical protein
MQVNSAQDYLTTQKRRIIAKSLVVSPNPQKRRNNGDVISTTANSSDIYNRFIIPTIAPGPGSIGGATFVSYCCSGPPVLSSFTTATVVGTAAKLVTWVETGHVTSRTVTAVNGTVTNVTRGSATVTVSTNGSVTVTIFNSFTNLSATATLSLLYPCFLGFVKLTTSIGAIAIENIKIGYEILQPNGSYSRVKNVLVTPIGEYDDKNDTRLFSDESGKCVVTYWHRLSIGGGPEYRAVDHPDLHEVYREFPFNVYNLELENESDMIMVHDTEIVAESYIANNVSNIPLTKENDPSRIEILA